MKRIVAATLIWLLLIGGVALYMRHRRNVAHIAPTGAGEAETLATGIFSAEVTTSFSATPDPFALQTDAEPAAAALVLRLGTNEILRLEEGVEAGRPVVVDRLAGLVEGANELFLRATPSPGTQGRHFVQLRVMRDAQPVAEEIFWSEGGAGVAGSLRFELTDRGRDEHGH